MQQSTHEVHAITQAVAQTRRLATKGPAWSGHGHGLSATWQRWVHGRQLRERKL